MSLLMQTPDPKTPTTPDPDTGGEAYESLPPALIPDATASATKATLEAEMVAVQGLVLKACKYMPDTLKWDGKPDNLASFTSAMLEWVDIRLARRSTAAARICSRALRSA